MLERVADSLALLRFLGKASLLITITTNPKWLEIVSQLGLGQTAADILVVVCRAFQARLVALERFLYSRFSCVVYKIKVIEF